MKSHTDIGVAPDTTKSRVAWLDIARGLMVVCVVLVHYRLWHGRIFEIDLSLWAPVARELQPFRMPMLFVISGMLVSEIVRRGWSEPKNRTRTVSSYYLYVVWLLIYGVISLGLTQMPHTIGSWGGLFDQLLIPRTPLWFVFFLAINMVIFTSVRRLPPAAVLVGIVLVCAALSIVDLPNRYALTLRGGENMFYFALGVYLKPYILKFPQSHVWWKLALSATAYVVIGDVSRRIGAGRPFSWLALDVAQALAVIAVVSSGAALLSYWRPISRLLQFVGRRTVDVYVMHVPLLWGAILVFERLPAEIFEQRWFELFSLPIIVLAVSASALAIGAIMRRVPGGRWLFDIPDSWKRRLLRPRR